MLHCIPAVGESYDCAKAAISLKGSNSFPWPEDCVQLHQTHFSQRVGSGQETIFYNRVHCKVTGQSSSELFATKNIPTVQKYSQI